jgi:hypothetical protein
MRPIVVMQTFETNEKWKTNYIEPPITEHIFIIKDFPIFF